MSTPADELNLDPSVITGTGPGHERRVRDLLDRARLERKIRERVPAAREELKRLGAAADLDEAISGALSVARS